MPIFRLHKAHVRFLLSLSLSTKPAVWKAVDLLSLKVRHPLAQTPTLWAAPGSVSALILSETTGDNDL